MPVSERKSEIGPVPGTNGATASVAWRRIPARTRQHAQKLKKALSGVIDMRNSRTWRREDLESVGLRDYRAVFGHTISARTFWRMFDRIVERCGADGDCSRVELYLPASVQAAKKTTRKAGPDGTSPDLQAALNGVTVATEPTEAELLLVWSAACSEWINLVSTGLSEAKATRRVLAELKDSFVELSRTPAGLRKTFKRKLDRWVADGYTPEAIRDRRAIGSGNHRASVLSDTDRKKLIARALQGSVAKAWRDAMSAGELESMAQGDFISNPSSKSYVPKRIRDDVGPDVRALDRLHHGPRQAELNGAYITRDWSGVGPGDWYSADDTTLPLYYWEEDEFGVPRVLRGQCLLMNDCRSQRLLGFALHSDRNYTAKVIRGLILNAHDTYGLPRFGFMFERGTWASAKLLKGTKDEVPSSETEVGLREWVEFKHAKPGNARAKTVERIIGIIQDNIEDQPGYCGRNEMVEKFERLQKLLLDAKAGRRHPREFLLHRDEWADRLEEILDRYNNEAQEGQMLRGQSPREAWETLFDGKRPLTRLDGGARYLLSNHRRPLKIGRNGICVQIGKERHWFRNEDTGRLIGRTVQVYFDPEDLSSVFFKQVSTDRTAVVVPAAASIPAMAATPEQLREANASVQAHSRHLKTLYRSVKSHFPDNGPSPFRQVIADEESAGLSHEIAADQEAIRKAHKSEDRKQSRLLSYQRRFGSTAHQDAVPTESQLIGYRLLEEAQSDDGE